MNLFLDLVLQREWMGHPAGSKIRLVKGLALQLIQRGSAILAVDAVERKSMTAAPRDKMVRRAAMRK